MALPLMFSWEIYEFFRRCHWRGFLKKAVLKNFAISTEKLQTCNFVKKGLLTQVFSSAYCKIFKNIYFEEHLLTAASDFLKQLENTGEIFINRLGTIKLLTIQSEFINVCFYGRRCGKKYGFCKHFLIFCKQFSIFCKHFSISCKHFSIYCDQI